MHNRRSIGIFFLFAFVISLAHASIPHTHPEPNKQSEPNHSNLHGSSAKVQHDHSGHHEHANKHSHKDEHRDESKPEFSHFSNADYLGNPSFQFTAKEKYALAFLQPRGILIEIRMELERALLFPRARDLPPDKHRSSQSLRAPPVLPNSDSASCRISMA